MTITNNLLEENMLLDLREMLTEMDGGAFTDADLMNPDLFGMDLKRLASHIVITYKGRNRFMNDLKVKQDRYGKLSLGQLRAALNGYRRDVLGLSWDEAQEEMRTVQGDRCFTCRDCNYVSFRWEEMKAHRVHAHGASPLVAFHTEEEARIDAEETPTEVLAVTTDTGLDLSNLPDGRYAAPNMSGGPHDMRYLSVSRVRRTVRRDRRYRYGEIITGNEIVEAGTIEVREWSSDSKRLAGQQKPDGTYCGEFQKELELIMFSPENWSKIFGQRMQRCGICGKSLTDEISQADGFGPECITKDHYFLRRPESHRQMCTEGGCASTASPTRGLGDKRFQYRCKQFGHEFVVNYAKQSQ